MGEQTGGTENLCEYKHPWFVCNADDSLTEQKKCQGFEPNHENSRCSHWKKIDSDTFNCTHFGLHKKTKK